MAITITLYPPDSPALVYETESYWLNDGVLTFTLPDVQIRTTVPFLIKEPKTAAKPAQEKPRDIGPPPHVGEWS